MKNIYININCSGYYWWQLTNFEFKEGRVNFTKPSMDSLKKLCQSLMSSEVPSFWIVKGEGQYFLGINKVPEKVRRDTYNRPLMANIVFVDEKLETLQKILSFWFTYPIAFADYFTNGCVKIGTTSPICLIDKLKEALDKMSKTDIINSIKNIDSHKEVILMGYEGGKTTIEKTFGIKIDNSVMLRERDFIIRDDNGTIVGSTLSGGQGDAPEDPYSTIAKLNREIAKLKGDIEIKKEENSSLQEIIEKLKKENREHNSKIVMIKRLKTCCTGLSLLLIISIICYILK